MRSSVERPQRRGGATVDEPSRKPARRTTLGVFDSVEFEAISSSLPMMPRAPTTTDHGGRRARAATRSRLPRGRNSEAPHVRVPPRRASRDRRRLAHERARPAAAVQARGGARQPRASRSHPRSRDDRRQPRAVRLPAAAGRRDEADARRPEEALLQRSALAGLHRHPVEERADDRLQGR